MRDNEDAALPSEFRRISLELAREPGRPEGDRFTGYMIVAPLTADGHLDSELARDYRNDCTVVRRRRGANPEVGQLRHGPGGAWSFHYELAGASEDDDPAYRLNQHRFIPGEYITVVEDNGVHTYRVVSVAPL